MEQNFTRNLQAYKDTVLAGLNASGALKYYNEYYSNYKLVEETINKLLDILKEKQIAIRNEIDTAYEETAQEMKEYSNDVLNSFKQFNTLFKKFYGSVLLEYKMTVETINNQIKEIDKKIEEINKKLAKENIDVSLKQTLNREKTSFENEKRNLFDDLGIIKTKIEGGSGNSNPFKTNALDYFLMPYPESTITIPDNCRPEVKEVLQKFINGLDTYKEITDKDPIKTTYRKLNLQEPFLLLAEAINKYFLYFYTFKNANIQPSEDIEGKYFDRDDLNVKFFLSKEFSKWYDSDASRIDCDNYEAFCDYSPVNGVKISFKFGTLDLDPDYIKEDEEDNEIKEGKNEGKSCKIVIDSKNNIKGIYLNAIYEGHRLISGNRYRGRIDFGVLKERVKNFDTLKYGDATLKYGLFELIEVALILYLNSVKQANIANKNIELINNIFFNKENHHSIAYILQLIQETYKMEIDNKKARGQDAIEFIEENWNAIYDKTKLLGYWNNNIVSDNEEKFKQYLKEAVIDIYNVGPGLLGEMENTKKTIDLSELFIKANGEYILKFDYFDGFRTGPEDEYRIITKQDILGTLLSKKSVYRINDFDTLFWLKGVNDTLKFEKLFGEEKCSMKINPNDKRSVGSQQFKYLKDNEENFKKSQEKLIKSITEIKIVRE